MTYRIRQVAQMFVIEAKTAAGWRIVDEAYSWGGAYELQAQYDAAWA